MKTTTHEGPPVPPPPPFALSVDLEEGEHHIDLDDDDAQGDDDNPNDDTVCEQVEFMGSGYRSLADYFVRQLEEFVAEPVQWILTTMDMSAVQRRFEAGMYRYILEGTSVYRASAKANPKPTPGEDPPGPWMPTRGGA